MDAHLDSPSPRSGGSSRPLGPVNMKPKWPASVLVLLALGIAIRLPDLARPLDEGHRNAQTAALTAGMVESGHLRLDPIAPWRGDLEARLVQELPVYNLAVLLVDGLPGITLDMAGRATSLIFWILSFIALQALWRRTLPPKAAFWANLLFIFAPINWYLSTAFMPESLLQLLAIGFMVFALDYARKSTWGAFAGLFITSFLGLLIKFPGFVHLGLFAALVLIDRQGWKSLFRPILLSAGLVIAICLLAWGEYVKAVNGPHFADWAGWENIVGFIRPQVTRLSPSYWLPLVGYNVAFITTIVSVPFVAVGMWRFCTRMRQSFRSRVWVYLLLSLLLSWLVWGKGAAAQNYYNLPNLVFFCAAFGFGIAAVRGYLTRKAWTLRLYRWSSAGLAATIALLGLAGHQYLSRSDRATIAVAEWVSANLPPYVMVAYQPRHAPAVMDYSHQPLLSHRTGRRTWVLVRKTPAAELEQAFARSGCFIVTHPEDNPGLLEDLRQKFKGSAPAPPPSLLGPDYPVFRKVEENELFTAFVRENLN
jgi:hypothetical protein